MDTDQETRIRIRSTAGSFWYVQFVQTKMEEVVTHLGEMVVPKEEVGYYFQGEGAEKLAHLGEKRLLSWRRSHCLFKRNWWLIN
jgi:hypothetical protein